MRNSIKNRAFTLAEVLITLAIIGVVAALTIPTVVKNYQKQQTAVKLKKVYAVFSQALQQSQAEHGFGPNTDFYNDNGEIEERMMNERLLKYLKISKYCGTVKTECYAYPIYALNRVTKIAPTNYYDSESTFAFIFSDGIAVELWFNGTGGDINAYVDLNGKNKPNTLGKDVFNLGISFSKNKVLLSGAEKNRDTILDTSGGYNCNEAKTGLYCSALIQIDGWQIKDDYPW